MILKVGLLAALLSLTPIAPAHALPITAALFGAAFASTFLGGVVSAVFGIAISYGLGLLANALFKKKTTTVESGVQLDVKMGDDNPVSFTVGRYATAGSRKYIGTWGADGKTPNAYLTDVVQIGDLPAPRTLTTNDLGLWVDGELCTILWGDTPTDQGYPVEEFRDDAGKDHLWVWYRDGTETTVSSFLFDKFGAHEDRPWTAAMIGRGCPNVIITALFNRDLFSGSPRFLFEVPRTPWYDVRLDTTAGGSGSHRWATPSTWEPTDNPAVILYNIIRGVYYGDEWVYGGQDLPGFRLPAASWMAAANECDATRDLVGGGTEPQFRCGYEIRGDEEPLTAIEEIAKACSGRLAEVGGIFKLLIGLPGSSVYAFGDGDVLVTEGQTFTPFPTLDNTHNGIEANYPEPEEGWELKNAPARYDAALEADDGDRRLATGITFEACPYPVQVQQLMRTMLEEERRFRLHSFYLPPEAWALEPNDVVSWSSTRNGYESKQFLVVEVHGERTSNQLVSLKEIDPDDYSWSSAFEAPISLGSLVIVRPPPQAMTGWQVEPASFLDDNGIARRPSMRVSYDGDMDDVRAVRIQVRLVSSGAIVFDGEQPYGPPEAGAKSVILIGTFLPDTDYEARGIFVPHTGRATTWSAWLAVTTPDVRISVDDFNAETNALVTEYLTENDALRAAVDELIARYAAAQHARQYIDKINKRIEVARERVERVQADADTAAVIDTLETEVTARLDVAESNITTTQTAFADHQIAYAGYQVTITAQFAESNAAITINGEAIADNTSAIASLNIALSARIDGVEADLEVNYVTFADQTSAFAAYSVTLAATYRTASQVQATASAIAQTAVEAFETGAFATYKQSVTANFGGLQAQVDFTQEAVADIDGNLSGRATVRVSAGNKVTGITLYGNQNGTGFDVDTDFFRVGREGSAAFVPVFQVGVNQNGQSGRMVLRGDMILTGSVRAAAINTAELFAITATITGLFTVGTGGPIVMDGPNKRIVVSD